MNSYWLGQNCMTHYFGTLLTLSYWKEAITSNGRSSSVSPTPEQPMNILAVGSGISSMPWTIAPNSFMGSVWSVLLYIGFLAYVWVCLKAEQTELYIFTVTKGDRPTLYWSTMGIMTVLAVIFGFYLMKNLYSSFS